MDTGIVVVKAPITPDVTDRFVLEEARCFRAVSKDRRGRAVFGSPGEYVAILMNQST